MTKQNGFTLIELLVSMGIIAVLTGMAVFNFNQSRMRARDVQRKNDLSQLVNAMEIYKNDNGSYPESGAGFQDDLLAGGYTKVTFNDPKGSEWSTYDYQRPTPLTYSIMSCLENTADKVRAVESQCDLHENFLGDDAPCACGSVGSGVMYVVSNP